LFIAADAIWTAPER